MKTAGIIMAVLVIFYLGFSGLSWELSSRFWCSGRFGEPGGLSGHEQGIRIQCDGPFHRYRLHHGPKEKGACLFGGCEGMRDLRPGGFGLFPELFEREPQGAEFRPYSDIKKNYFIVTKNNAKKAPTKGETVLVLFEPDERMVPSLKKYNPSKVKVDGFIDW